MPNYSCNQLRSYRLAVFKKASPTFKKAKDALFLSGLVFDN